MPERSCASQPDDGTMNKGHIVVCITCHNRRNATLTCLATLRSQQLPDGVRISVVLVDDGCSDDTAEAVRSAFPDTVIQRTTDGERYWAGGMLAAERVAETMEPDYLLWLNDDVVLVPDAVATLLEVSHKTGGIAVACLADPETEKPSYGGQVSDSGWHPLRLRLLPPNGSIQNCDTFQGNCVLIPASCRDRGARLDPIFDGVQGMADTDLGLRAGALNIPIGTTPHFIGTCTPNRNPPPWQSPATDRLARLRAIVGPRGFPPRAWFHLVWRHAGLAAPAVALPPVIRAIRDALIASRAHKHAKPKVALIEGVTPAYRLSYYQALAARDDIDFLLYDGIGLPGQTVDQAPPPLPLPIRRGRNLYWPGKRRGRIAWSNGTIDVLRRQPDAVVVGQHVHDLSIWALWLWRQIVGRPKLIAMGHFRLTGDGIVHRLRRLFVRNLDGALCYAPSGREEALRCGLPVDRVAMIANTLDTDHLLKLADARAGQREEICRRLGINSAEHLFLFLGRLHKEKRVTLAADAVGKLRDDGIPARLVIIGDGPERDAIAALPYLTCLGSIHNAEQVADWMAICVAVVVPDAVGLVAVHALASMVPVVTLANGRSHGPEIEYLHPGKDALFAATDADLVVQMTMLINQPNLRQQLQEGCRHTAQALSMAHMTDAVCTCIGRVIGKADGQ